MKKIKVRRLDDKVKVFNGGSVQPRYEGDIDRGPHAYGFVFDGVFFELPACNGTYLIIDRHSTNQYGFDDGGRCSREVVSIDVACGLGENVMAGVIDQAATITVNGDSVSCSREESNIVRRQNGLSKPMPKTTAAEFKNAQSLLGLTNQALADALHVSLRAVEAWRQGTRPVPGPVEVALKLMIEKI